MNQGSIGSRYKNETKPENLIFLISSMIDLDIVRKRGLKDNLPFIEIFLIR